MFGPRAVGSGIITTAVPLVQDRPPFKLDALTWDDHSCEHLYLPAVNNATAVTVSWRGVTGGCRLVAGGWQD